MKTRLHGGAAEISESPVGDSFDDYVAEVEAGLGAESQAMLGTFRAYYTLASQAITLRKARKWTQQAAKAAGVPQSDTSRLDGAGKLSVPKLTKIAHAYGKAVGFMDEDRRSSRSPSRGANATLVVRKDKLVGGLGLQYEGSWPDSFGRVRGDRAVTGGRSRSIVCTREAVIRRLHLHTPAHTRPRHHG